MGWASGSRLLNDVACVVMPYIAEKKRREVARRLIEEFEHQDCDTIDEVTQEDVRAEFRRQNPIGD